MDLGKLLAWRDVAGKFYGSEDQALFLYSLIKMYGPRTVVELGTGLGVSTFWIAQALRENGSGHLLSLDDGSHWNAGAVDKLTFEFAALLRRLGSHAAFAHLFPPGRVPNYADFLRELSRLFELETYVSFAQERLELTTLVPQPNLPWLTKLQGSEIDLLYSDFSHGPHDVLALLSQFLPHMASSSSILIDSASTLWLSYFVLEQTIAQMNAGKVPAGLLVDVSAERREKILTLVATRRFTLMHMVERKDREQNGLAWIKIEPVNVVPYPLTAMRHGAGQLMPRSTVELLFEPERAASPQASQSRVTQIPRF
jgi:Methyltransferase domain